VLDERQDRASTGYFDGAQLIAHSLFGYSRTHTPEGLGLCMAPYIIFSMPTSPVANPASEEAKATGEDCTRASERQFRTSEAQYSSPAVSVGDHTLAFAWGRGGGGA